MKDNVVCTMSNLQVVLWFRLCGREFRENVRSPAAAKLCRKVSRSQGSHVPPDRVMAMISEGMLEESAAQGSARSWGRWSLLWCRCRSLEAAGRSRRSGRGWEWRSSLARGWHRGWRGRGSPDRPPGRGWLLQRL